MYPHTRQSRPAPMRSAAVGTLAAALAPPASRVVGTHCHATATAARSRTGPPADGKDNCELLVG